MMSPPAMNPSPPAMNPPTSLPASFAGMMTMTTKCYAIKFCANLRAPAIFWRWEDASFYVDPRMNPHRPAEYQQCDNVFRALEFMMGSEEYSAALLLAEAEENRSSKPVTSEQTAATPETNITAVSSTLAIPQSPPHLATHKEATKARIRHKKFKANLEKLREYKSKYGHFRVERDAKKHALASIFKFYMRTRCEVRNYQRDPTSSALNDAEFETLKLIGLVEELDKKPSESNNAPATTNSTYHLKRWGFVFPTDDEIKAYYVGKKDYVGKNEVDKILLTWEESYQNLIEYKNRHGHAVVPRRDTRLGNWTHTQRKQYHKLQRGEKSTMTDVRLGKLTEIGFVFSNSNWRDRNSNGSRDNQEDDDNDDDNQVENQDHHVVTGMAQEPAGL